MSDESGAYDFLAEYLEDLEESMTNWYDIAPKDAVDINLAERLDITAPLNENGERCPWPWEPQQRVGWPIGQYHCTYCLAMVVAGMPHFDYKDDSPLDLGRDGA